MVSKDGTKRRKIVAELKPTYKCNQRCIFCLWEHRKRLPRMDIKKLKLVTDYMRESLKPDALILSGGEPMVLKDFPEILDIVRQNLRVEVFHLHTCGMTDEEIDDLYRVAISRARDALIVVSLNDPLSEAKLPVNKLLR